VVAPGLIADVIAKLGGHIVPLVEAPIEVDCHRRPGCGRPADALVAPDVGDELVVVAVAVAAPHGLDVAAVLLIELVHEHHGRFDAGELVEPHGDPLIPAGDEHEPGVLLERPLPLLGEVQAEVHGAGPGVARAVVEAPPLGVRLTHRSEAVPHGVLGHTDGHLLLLAARVREHVLRVDLEPAPHVGPRRAGEVAGLRGAEGEEVADGRGLVVCGDKAQGAVTPRIDAIEVGLAIGIDVLRVAPPADPP